MFKSPVFWVLLLIGATIAFAVGVSLATRVVGPDWHLRRTDGAPLSRDSLAGQPILLNFGYTFCPDVCPSNLSTIASALKQMGDQGDKVHVVFVTVDPERDTDSVVQEYTALFDKRIIGATGSPEQLEAMLQTFGITAIFRYKQPENEFYLIDHTATTLLLDKTGLVVNRLHHGTSAADIAAAVQRHL